MKIRHILLACLVAAIWGLSFVVVAIGLRGCPPLLLAALRFMIVFVFGVAFLSRPTSPLKLYIRAGLCLGVIQFACMFSAIHLGVPAGIVSVLAQLQVFITLLLSGIVLRERSNSMQQSMMALALFGVLLLGYARYHATLPITPVILALLGAAGFAWGNIELKRAGKVDMFAFTVWMSLIPPIPLLLLSILMEGGTTGLFNALEHLTWMSILALLFLAVAGTLFSLGAWGKLMNLYPAAVVAPFSLISPVFGMVGGWIVLGERYDAVSIIASGLIVLALAGNTYVSRSNRHPVNNRRVQTST
ncbi:EamA family transporter [Paraburkholderia silvatlantica]|uniref:O-acetylserine/cysteine efflux transporter n=1 Tax=Paraburkholderia silvatlantica TaxID=321895 RepID=A0A2V4TT32_9BURK|nr:EamA family transporter [Paraburkholderia silvatlantica]PYE21303.1 O-acetylserine/cysteine efflux transporter [Paraburkholderia silvatlantica]TDQ86556.1 O-acetylserine/cysteine efflux transporter [Paraburkholderia silvatlantica]